jgi:hypothetical protein
MQSRFAALLAGFILILAPPAFAERTDELILLNGNTITGEVKSLQQGKLRFKTDNAGTIYIEWEFVHALTASGVFDVENTDGQHFYGSLSNAEKSHFLMVIGPTGPVVLDMDRVISIAPIKQTFWSRVNGSLNIGASYTSADNILQYSVEGDATYRQRRYSARTTLSSIQTRINREDEEGQTTVRDSLDFVYTRYRKNRYFAAGAIDFTRSSEQGIDFRTEISWAYGRRFKQTNKSTLQAAAGLTVSRETPTGGEPSGYFLSGALIAEYHFFLYNFPKTDLLIQLGVRPGITDWPRLRVDFNGSIKREIVTDFTVNFSISDNYDSDPPGGELAANHDFAIVFSVGWTF